MADALTDVPTLTIPQLREIVTDSDELAKGAMVFDRGELSHLSRHGNKLFADAQGSSVYKVQAIVEAKGWRGRCSCMAARSRPFCKHAAGLLVAWQRNPDGFAISAAPPAGSEPAKKKKVKTSKAAANDLMAKGVEQVVTLVRELAIAGAATLAADRAAQVRALGENLREHKLRRLSAKTIALADMLEGSRDEQFDELGYAELLGDLLLTAKKLERHLGGELLEDHHVEELIGKTWTKKDRAPITGLDIIEVGFVQRVTADNFSIRESRFVDVSSGGHYSEKQILPAFLVKRTPPKPSYAGKLLRGAGGGLYPGYAPRRTDLESTGAVEPLTTAALDQLVARAIPSVKQAIASLAEHRKDVFAPDALPATIACEMVIADRGRLQLADRDGSAMFLPDDDPLCDRVATALSGATLEVVIGDVSLDGALPTLVPLALVVTGRGGRELRSISVTDPAVASRKIKKVETERSSRRSDWAQVARGLGLSTAAIALGEIREQLAGMVVSGLASVSPPRTEPMAARLDELGLAKQAALLRETARRDDVASRLDDVIKLHQVLGIALARLAGAAQVERDELTSSPMYASVYVRKDTALCEPEEIRRRFSRGDVNRFEASALYARYYEHQPPEHLLDRVFPTWADGSASTFVALAARQYPERALATALSVTTIWKAVSATAVERFRLGGVPRMAVITALRVLEVIGGPQAQNALRTVANNHPDYALRNMARAAMGRLAGVVSADTSELQQHRNKLLNADTADVRATAAERLADAGDLDAIPLLRMSFAGDVASSVRDAAGRALGRLGDADSVDTFCRAVYRRDEDSDAARTAAYALGYLGDVRGIEALVAAYQGTWMSDVVPAAIGAAGAAAIPYLLDAFESNPDLLKRSTAKDLVAQFPVEPLLDALIQRVEAHAQTADFVQRATRWLDMVKDRAQVARELGAQILRVRPELMSASSREERALARKASATAS